MLKVKLIGFMGIVLLLLSGFFTCASATFITGGDAADQASADDILDIVFVIDTSGSMWDDINAIGTVAETTIQNLECPDCDVWARASFMSMTDYTYGIFNESVTSMVTAAGGTPITNSSEDNGPAVVDLVNYYNWNDDSTADQDYYKAIVTIGDEGTENGYPIYQNDYDAAYLANQAAINSGTFLFSLATDPYPGVSDLFNTMATGGSLGGYLFGDTGGSFLEYTGPGDSATLATYLEDIICTAGGGGTGGTEPVPEPGTILLMGVGLAGLAASRMRKKKLM